MSDLANVGRRIPAPIPATVTGVTGPGDPAPGGPSFNLREVAKDLPQPVQVTRAPGDSTGLYVVGKAGTIERLGPPQPDAAAAPSFIERLPKPLMVGAGALAGLGAVTGAAALAGRMSGKYHVPPGLQAVGYLLGAAGLIAMGEFALATALDKRPAAPAAPGAVARADASAKGGPLERSTILDISSQVDPNGERGLLSVAFHPNFAKNGRLFVNFTDVKRGDTHVTEYHAVGGKVDASSGKDLMVIRQPYPNHNGGQLQFGPDGMLYIGMGDGGSGGDPENRSQDLRQHLGKILRIDVDHPQDGKGYGIPADNPYADGVDGAKPEIWATGVRNPWRFSFDAKTGDMWIGDVGQNRWEEIDYLPAGTLGGANLGWDLREGANMYENKAPGAGPIVDPVLQYSHDEGSSITGGYVYRGKAIPSLEGYYVYADIAKQEVRALKLDPATNTISDRRRFPVGDSYMVSFGEGPDGELYVASISGSLNKFVPKEGQPTPVDPAGPSGPVGPVGGGTPSTTEIGVDTSRDMRFDKSEIRVPAGKVTLHFTNNDPGMYHNIAIKGNGVSATSGNPVRPGQQASVTADLTPGTYEFYCDPHYFGGMKGKLIVE